MVGLSFCNDLSEPKKKLVSKKSEKKNSKEKYFVSEFVLVIQIDSGGLSVTLFLTKLIFVSLKLLIVTKE